MTKFVVIFDFDHSLVDDNTDTVVFDVLDPSLIDTLRSLQESVQWTELMDRLLGELHTRGRGTPADIHRAMASVRLRPGMSRILERLRKNGNESKVYIASDSNTFYIDAVLAHYGFLEGGYVDRIFTNPATVDAEGRLRVRKYVDGHRCDICTAVNMCKGDIWRGLEYDRSVVKTVFVCDGSNDLCLVLSLGSGDVALAREGKGFGLQKKLRPMVERGEVRATVVWWTDYDQLDSWFQEHLV